MVHERVLGEDGWHAHHAQPEAQFEIFPAVLVKALVEPAGFARQVERQRHIGGPKIAGREVAPRPAGGAMLAERSDVDDAALADGPWVSLVTADVRREQPRRREHVVVHDHEIFPTCPRDAGVAAARQSGVLPPDAREGAGRPYARDDVLVGAVGRAVVDENDLVSGGTP